MSVPMSRARICSTPSASGTPPPESAHSRNGRELGDVVGQVVGEEAADVGERGPAVADRGDDRGEVVVEQHQVGGLAGDVGAAAAHRHTDVGLAQRRAVVHPVAGHRDDVAARRAGRGRCAACPPGSPGRRRRRRRRRPRRAPPSSAGSSAAVSTGLPGRASPTCSAMARPVAGWSPVIIMRRDVRGAALGDGVGDAVAGRVLQADEPQQVAARSRARRRRRRPTASARGRGGGDGEHPQAARGPSAPPRRAPARVRAAQREHGVRCAEDGGLERTAAVADDHQGAPARGVEGDPAPLRPGDLVGGRVEPAAQRQHVQRDLHRVAQRRPPALALHDAARRRVRAAVLASARDGAPPRSVRVDPAGRVVAGAAGHGGAGGRPDRDRGHLVAGDRAGLVGADHGGRAEGLDRLQPADQGVLAGHGVRGPGQRERDGGQQALGHQGDGDPDGEHEALGEGHARARARRRRTRPRRPAR